MKFKSTRGKMSAGLLILRVASLGRDAQNERDGAGLRSSVAAATPSQLRRSSTTTYSTQLVFVVSLLEVLPAAPRGGTRRHLERGRALRAAPAPSQQHQLRRSSSSRRRQCPASRDQHERSTAGRGFLWKCNIGQPLELFAPGRTLNWYGCLPPFISDTMPFVYMV